MQRSRKLAVVLGIAIGALSCNPTQTLHGDARDAGGQEKGLSGDAPRGPPPRVIVVGAGIAGLVAAYDLEKRGIAVHILEASEGIGGRVQTAYYGEGMSAEFGMQEMWQGNPLLDIAKELGVEMDPEPEEPFSSVILEEKLHPYIQKNAKEYFAALFSPQELKAYEHWMKQAKSFHDDATKLGLKSQKMRELQAMSFAAWVQSAKLPKKVSEFIKLTLECELATTWEQFSALDGLLELELFFGNGLPNYHVKGGNTRLMEAIARAIKSPKTFSAQVQGVNRIKSVDGRVRVQVTYLKSNRVETMEAERVVLAVPFVRLPQVNFEPSISEERWRAIQGLGLGQYVVVHFIISKDAENILRIGGKSPFPVLSDGPLGVIYGVQQETPENQPLEVFALLIYGMRARMFHMIPRDAKVRELEEELDKLWPGFSKHVRASHVYSYHPAALAVFPPGRSPLDEGAELVRTPELGTYLAGDWTLGSHSADAAKSGLNVARQIAAELGAAGAGGGR
jgi:monoamine oxidase